MLQNNQVIWRDKVNLILKASLDISCIITNIPENTKHLYNICTMLVQRRRRWTDVVQMLYKCFLFAGYDITQHLLC